MNCELYESTQLPDDSGVTPVVPEPHLSLYLHGRPVGLQQPPAPGHVHRVPGVPPPGQGTLMYSSTLQANAVMCCAMQYCLDVAFMSPTKEYN